MNIVDVLLAAAVIGILGLLIGVLLGFASEKFKVEVNELEIVVRELLPGINCGACGYPGCDGMAHAIATGEAPVNGCPVGGVPVATSIAEVMGVESADVEKQVAFVMCAGTKERAKDKYNYHGIEDCNKAHEVPGRGPKDCTYGCVGYGSCVKACNFDAIHIIDGVAVVDKEKCVSCEKCVPACPKSLIEMVPYKARNLVQCHSNDKGKDTRLKCTIGCIACKLCEKACAFDAIHVVDNLAHIDYSKCTNCNKCAEVCPVKVIL